MIAIAIRVAGLLGFSLTPFVAHLAIAGVVAIALAGVAGRIHHAGKAACEAAHAAAVHIEERRQRTEVENIQQADAARARDAEPIERKNQEAINATPANALVCFDRGTAGRVRNVR